MDEKYILDLYNQLGGQSKFGNFEDFKDAISTDKIYQKDFYSAFGESTLGNFEDFSSLVSSQSQAITPKKKGESMVSDSEVSSSELPWGDVFRINKDTETPPTESTSSDGKPSGYKFNFWGNEVSPESIEEQAKQREDAQKRAATLQRKPYTTEEMEAGKQKLKAFEQGYTPKEPGIGGIDFAMPEVKSESTRVEKPIDIKTEKEKEKQRIILEEQQKKRQEAKDLENWRQSNIKSDEAVKLEKEKRDSAFNRSLTDIELSSSLLSVNQDLIDKDQNTAIEELTNQFGKYGFNFKPGGEWLGHSLIVSTDDGKNSIPIDLKPGSDKLKESESLKLRNFISNYNIVPETKKSFIDQEGENFYKERNRDYYTEKRRWERYNELNDIVGFFEGYIKKGKEKVEQQYPDLFYKGDPVWNIGEKIQEYKQELETLRPLLKDDTFFSQTNTAERTREDFDAFLAKKENEIIKSAAEVNKQAKVQEDAISEESRRLFNMDIQDLIFYKSDNPEYQKDIDNLINQFIDAQDTRKGAAARYEFAKLYYNEKVNKDINGDLTDNFVALWNTVGDNYKQGLVNDQLLALAMPGMYIPYSGTTDLKEASEYIINKLNTQSGTQSRVETRLQNAKTRQDYIDVMLDNPLESMVIAAAGSLSLMLPTGFKIIPAFTAGGAYAGSVVPGVGTVLGAGRGFEVGQAVNSYALEYTSAIMEAVENSGYNPMDPESLAAGLADEKVWKNATDQSLARGIPIALADYMSSKLTGRVFKPSSKLDGLGKRIALGAAERVIVDPALEAAGEALAQSSEIFFGTGRGELDIKEIIAEGRGALGSKLPNMIGQLYYNAKTETNAGLASNLTKIHNVGVATESDEKISNWANNMQQLGKIDADVNQRIQENVGLRRDAKELLNIGTTEKKSEGPVVSRVMELLSAKKELSATKNRQEVYAEKIKEINNELATISQTKKLLPDDKKTNLDGIIEAKREDVSEYKINGVVYNKDKFLSKLNSMSSNRLMNATIGIKGDEETSKLLKDKVDAIQKQTAGEVLVQPEARVGEEVVQGKPEAGLEVTSEQIVLSPKEKERKGQLEKAEINEEKNTAFIPETGELLEMDEYQNELETLTKKEQVQVTPEAEVKVEEVVTEQAPAEVKTPEQEADLLEELLTGKKKEPVMTPQVETMTPEAEVMTPEAKAEQEMIVQPEFTEQDQARKRELEDALKKADKRKKNVMVGEVSMPKAEAKAELDALRQKEQAVQPKFQKGDQVKPTEKIDSVVEEMNSMPEDVANFDVPSDLTTKNKVNISSLIKRFGDKLKAAFKGGIIKNISEYNGIPMIFTISDQLSSGKIKNEFTGNTIDVNGGLGFNLTDGNENNAWANTTEEESVKMLNRAKEVYKKNKDLFDRLWAEGKLPYGQIPMAIVKMGQDSIKTNEALFRFASDTIKKKFNKTERKNSLNGLIEDISAVDPKSKVISFIKDNNFKTIDELLDNINKLTPIGERATVTRFLFTGSLELNKETTAGKPRSKSALALVGDKDPSYYKYIHLQTINNIIQEDATKEIPSSHIIGITGVDVLNPEITSPNHRNYPYGVKGGLIGILESPVHAADIFPEMYSKTFYLQKENAAGNPTPPKTAVEQSVASGGLVVSTKAFVGSKMSTKMTELQKLLGKLKLAFPSVTIVETKQEFDKALNDPEVKKFVKDGEVVYGFTKDGKIFLNPEKANKNTAIHEFAHIWMNFLKENNSKLLEKGYALLEGTEVLKRKIDEFGNIELAREEALAELIANKGETLIEAGKKSKFKNWLNALYTYVKSKFKSFDKLSPEEFQNISLNDFVDGALASLLSGKEITSKEIKSIGVLFSKEKPKTNSDIIKIARANGISEAGIRAYFKKNGLSDIEIDELLEGEKGAGKKIELSEETLPGYTKLMNRINGVISRGRKSGKSDDVIMQGVIANVEANSPEYANATDQQREQIIRDIRKLFGKKEKAAPSAEKITGKPKPKKVTVNEMTALKDQIRLEARAAREAKGDLNTKRKMLAEAINKLAAKGTITVRQANAIINRVNLVNLDNPIMVEKLINYAEKVFKDAEYADKLSEANKLFSSIKQSSKSKEKNDDLVTLAKEFLGIDPSMVENIDEYIQKASELDSSLKGSKATAKGMSASEMINIQEATEYISETMKTQEQKIKEQTAAEIESTMGVDASDLTYEQMLELLEDESKPINKDKEKVIRSLVNKMFDTYSSIIEYMFKTGKNPFVVYDENLKYEPVTFKESDKQIVREFMKMDLGKLSVREALKAMDALNNFIVNRSVANMGSVVAQYKAKQNAEIVDKKNIRSKPVKYLWSNTLGKMLFDNFASFPLLIERFFKSKDIGLYVSKMMGLNDLFNGASSAKTITGVVVKNYLDLFSKTKPNGKVFNDAFNLVERGMVAFMSRHKVGTDAQIKEEFNDRKNEIEESIKALSTGTKREQEKAKVYKEVYDKLFKDAKNSDDIRNNADNKNIEAVDWWVNEWKNHYDELADVSLKIYNTKLDKDSYYTTDRYSKLEGVEKEIDLEDNVSAFSFNNGNISEKKAGSLMETRDKKSGLPKNKDGEVTRFVDLSFDAVNANSLYDALTDIKTAYAIKQVKAFMKTDAFKRIVPDKEERDILGNRINLAVRNLRNQKLFDSSTMSKAVKALNKFSSIGSTMALAGIVQPFKQTIPIAFNTAINTGRFFDLLRILTNSDVKDFINNSGYSIANRGIESSVHLESINKKLDEAAKTKAEYLGNKILELNEMYMKLFLANPDAWIARASWIAYYEKGLRKQGLYKTTETIKTDSGTREVTKKGIDYSKHKINKEAADYAQMMIDRQQNITDTRLAGSIYSGENAFQTMMTKIFLPLASFRINQHLRMSNDLATTFSKTTSWQEKREALTSLSGAMVEMLVFRSIGIGASYLFFELASMIRGEEEDEEKKKRKEKMASNTLKGILTGAVTDILSPVPITDYPVKYSVNAAMDFTQDLIGMADEDKLALYVENIPSFSNVLGTAGIFLDKVADIKETAFMAATGKFEQDVFGKKIEKEISEKDREILAWSLIPSILTNTILPGAPETNNIMSKVKKAIKKEGKTADQKEKYDAFGGHPSEKEFRTEDPKKYMESMQPGGSLYEYKMRENQKKMEELPKKLQKKMEETMEKANKMQ